MRIMFVNLIVIAIGLSGCSRSGEIEKSTVSGEVYYNSEPIEAGIIRFIPQGDTQGPLATSSISNGTYVVNAQGGVPVGTHRVEVLAYIELPRPENLPPMAPTRRLQYIPAKYNTNSELQFEVESGGNPAADFDLDGPQVVIPTK